jgi:hypothetical protein
MGGGPRQYMRVYVAIQAGEGPEERQRLYKTRGIRGGRIRDNTERKGRGYTKQGGSEGGGSAIIFAQLMFNEVLNRKLGLFLQSIYIGIGIDWAMIYSRTSG